MNVIYTTTQHTTEKSAKLEHYIDKNTYSTLRNKTLCKGQFQHIQSEDTDENSQSDTHADNEYSTMSTMQSAGIEADPVDIAELLTPDADTYADVYCCSEQSVHT